MAARGERIVLLQLVLLSVVRAWLNSSGTDIISATTETRMRLRCINWYGAHLETFVAGGLDKRSCGAIADTIVSIGANCVRIPLSVQLVLNNPAPPTWTTAAVNTSECNVSTALQVLDCQVQALTRRGLMVILNNHNSFAGWVGANERVPQGLWHTADFPTQAWVASLAVLATRYSNNSLDRYVFAYFCSCTKHHFLETCTWQQLVLDAQDVFDVRCCVDIGYCVRNIILSNVEADVLTKVIQSSLPYLKHNRLNFPPFEACTSTGVQDITSIVFGCCLGIFDNDGKKPPWTTRVHLVVFMHELLSRGSKRDLYIFCTTYMALVRIAVIEYFIFFMEKNMPIELELMPLIFSVEPTFASLHFVDLKQVCNNFRTVSFDTGQLNLAELNGKAMLMLERCNRICSHKIRIPIRTADLPTTMSLVHRAINSPLSVDIITHLINPDLDSVQLVAVTAIQNLITRDVLVLQLQELQMQALKKMCAENTVMAAKSLYCYVCLGCIDAFTQLDRKMRLHDGAVVHWTRTKTSSASIASSRLSALRKQNTFGVPSAASCTRGRPRGSKCTAAAFKTRPSCARNPSVSCAAKQ